MLTDALTSMVLNHLGCSRAAPSFATLAALTHAYVRRVPWESAFRIARKAAAQPDSVQARTPDEFWVDAIERGGGGTCFESNLAFFALLQTLGFGGYLTINNMGESVGCHTALVVPIKGQPVLVDVGIPLHRPLRLDPTRTIRVRAPFHSYVARPDGTHRYLIERTRHPRRYIFSLIDEPVPVDAYVAASTADYGDEGLFLDRVIIVKVIDDAIWRFSSSEQPYRIEWFGTDGVRHEFPLERKRLAETLAVHFAMDEPVLEAALAATS